ncbi:MAG: hypothetical protein Q9183_003437, partial [Haloplaca sp. 2 TL-2023]
MPLLHNDYSHYDKPPKPSDESLTHCFTYTSQKNLGADGCFNAGVYIVRSRRSGTRYVEKKYKTSDILNQNTAREEMNLLRNLRHPNIVKYITGFIEWSDPYNPTASVYTEYCDRGNLWDFMEERYQRRRMIGEEWLWDLYMQLVNAVAYCQTGSHNACEGLEGPSTWVGVLHRDIKLDNIFLASIPGSSATRAVLGDFGVAYRGNDSGRHGRQFMNGNKMTAPPEVVYAGYEYSGMGDVYSLGSCMSSLCLLEVEREMLGGAGDYYS